MQDERYMQWLEAQRRGRSGESLRRLMEGHAVNESLFARQIWLEAVGNLDHLYAEYEVPGFGQSSFFVDHAYLRPPHKVAWEIDDFSTHGQHASRRTFEYERERQNLLVLDGWTVFRQPLDTIRERPRKCRQFVLQTIGKLYGDFGADKERMLPLKQREIIRFAHKIQRPFKPSEIRTLLGAGDKQTRILLHDLVTKGWLESASGTQRVRSFQLRERFF